MSVDKKFYELQDMILAKVSLEKVRLHVMERKDKTVFSWVSRELSGFFRKFQNSEKFKLLINKIKTAIEKSDHEMLLKSVNETISMLTLEIEKYYRELQGP
ncbi:MAG: hypothetical protein QXV69_08830 [Sulfolobaceae archaeon]